jgi:hypothetical protein
LASLPTQRAEVGVAALDRMICVLGGQSPTSLDSKLNQECDSATDRSRDRAPLQRGMEQHLRCRIQEQA